MDSHLREFWRPFTMEEFIEENPPWLRGRIGLTVVTVCAVSIDEIGIVIIAEGKAQSVSFGLLFENFRYLCPDGWQVCGKLKED